MSEQNSLNLEDTGGVDSVEKYKFEPIKGYPMLNWHGKRPFTSTQYYPAQKKEVYGEEVNGWINKIFWGDNLQVMSHLLKEYRGKIDLIYIDPPFDSNADYKKIVKLKGKQAEGDQGVFEDKQYTDIWNNDEYLQFIYERLLLIRELMSENGSIFLHCDDAKNYLIRGILEEVFGGNNFRNEIIWKRSTSQGYQTKQCGVLHDTIFWYSKSENYTFNMQYHAHEKAYLKRARKDENGRLYIPIPSGSPSPRPNLYYEYKGYLPHENGYKWTRKKIEELDALGKLVFPKEKTGRIQLKQYLDEVEGVKLQDIWMDIPAVNPVAKERNGYPTQKPEALLERIIKMGSNEGDIVFDCFMGSGTTQAVAHKLKRRYLGTDINLGAIQITTKRLASLISEENSSETDSGFEVYNVNNYDVFRNPLEAVSLLIEALEIEEASGTMYDGKKNGYMVKVMPVNRIATREDLNELVANFPYKVFEQRKEQNPTKPVESLMLICMGHESDLKAHLEQECGYKLNVEVVDILRDKSNIEFKRDSEAEFQVDEKVFKIQNFYPMNLMQKLSLQKESVNEWRELVESIVIDWNYDGAAMEPTIVDIPDKNEFVLGEYKIPDDAGTIKIKITDLLSESYEEVIKHG